MFFQIIGLELDNEALSCRTGILGK